SSHGSRTLVLNELDHLCLCRSHRRVGIDIFSYHLRSCMGTHSSRSPTAFGPADAAKTAFILDHDQHGTLIFGWPRGDCRLSLRFKVFLKCSWACRSAFGCLGRGMSLRQP